MKILPPPLEIGDEEGFTSRTDMFGRSELGLGLANLMGATDQPLVVAIDGPWGCGKTTFLKTWAGLLRQQGFPVIYFDAFENDYIEDAFTALAGEIFVLAEQAAKADTEATRNFVEKAKAAGRILARSSLKLAVKGATAGALKLSDLEEIADDVAAEAEAIFDQYIGEAITKQRQRRDALEAFREALSRLSAVLKPTLPAPDINTAETDADADHAGRPRPLIFIIDELDRCRPMFALAVLERIKHFFAVPNVRFVLGAHIGQLQNSVRAAYGGEIDAHAYLQKFIHLTFVLADEAAHERERVVARYLQRLKRDLGFPTHDEPVVDRAMSLIREVADQRRLTLRELERIMSNLAVALAFTQPNQLRPDALIAGLCILKVTSPALYRQAKEGRLEYGEAAAALGFDQFGSNTGYNGDWFEAYWRFALEAEPSEEILKRFDDLIWRYNVDRTALLRETANRLVDRLTSHP